MGDKYASFSESSVWKHQNVNEAAIYELIILLISGIALATYFLRLQIVINMRGRRSVNLTTEWQDIVNETLNRIISANLIEFSPNEELI